VGCFNRLNFDLKALVDYFVSLASTFRLFKSANAVKSSTADFVNSLSTCDSLIKIAMPTAVYLRETLSTILFLLS
jgi:hypothetical protein